MAVAFPAQVKQQQRRGDFRLSLAGYDDLTAAVHAGTVAHGGAAPIDAPRFVARLLNISAGGVCALFDGPGTRKWQTGDVFFFTFTLPGIEAPFVTANQLRHLRRIHDGQSTVAGFKFLPWPLVSMKSRVQEITRFIAAEQRRQLRRGR